MREAILGARAPLTASRSPKKTASSGGPPSGQRGQPKRPGRPLSTRLALVVGSAGFSAIMIGIVLNATMMQKGHHPAPLFASAAAAGPAPQPLLQPVSAAAPPPMGALPLPVPLPPPPVVDDRTESLPPAATIKPPAQAGIRGKAPLKTPALASKTGGPAQHRDGIAHLLGAAPVRKSLARTPAALPPAKTTHAARNDKAATAPAVN